MLADVQERGLSQFVFYPTYVIWLECVLRLATAYEIGFAIQREVVLIAAQPRLGIGRPSDINTIRRGMIATIDQRHRATLLTKIHLALDAFDIEIAVDEQWPPSDSAPNRLLAIEVEGAMFVKG